MPGPIGQAELNTGCWLTLIHLKPRCYALGFTGTGPFVEPPRNWVFSPGDRRYWGSKSITGAGECLCWTSSWGDIVLVNPASNTQLNRLSNLNVQNLGRGPAGENCERWIVNGGEGCYPELISSKICALLGSSYRINGPSSTLKPSRQNVRCRIAGGASGERHIGQVIRRGVP